MAKKAKLNRFVMYVVAFSMITIMLTTFICSGYVYAEPLQSSSPTLSPESTTELQNCVWMVPYNLLPWSGHYPEGLGNELDNPQYMIDRLEGLNIDCVMVHGGNWKSDGTINYDSGTTFAMWTNFINAMKAWNPNMKVLVWVLGYGNTDLSNSSIRNTMYDSARQLLNSVPFDGWNEDYEGWDGDVADAMTFYQGIASTVKSMGKIATIATEVEWGGYHIEDYAYLTNFDYITPMFYAKVSSSNAEYYWNEILEQSPVPVIMGLAVLLKQNGGTPLAQQLKWIDIQSDSNLVGFSLWAYDYMSYEDFEAWEKWETKDTIGGAQPEPKPEPTGNFTLNPVADAFINSISKSANYGSENYLLADYWRARDYYPVETWRICYLRFDLSQLDKNSHGVYSARLRLWAKVASVKTSIVGVHLCSDNEWDEMSITWENAPPYSPEYIDVKEINSADNFYYWDVTEEVKNSQDRYLTLVLKIESQGEDYTAEFYSKEGYGNRPELLIHYLVIPEFPSWTIMLVALTVVAVSVVIYKKKLNQ